MSSVLHGLLGEPGQPSEAAALATALAELRALRDQRRPCGSERCEEEVRLEEALKLLALQLQRAVPPASAALSPLQEAARLAVPYEFSVPGSHRARLGRAVTAAKRAFIQGLEPFHVELLRPQADFNRHLVRVLEHVVVHRGLGLKEELEGWVRTQLEPWVDPTRWQVRSHRRQALGVAVELAKRSYLTALGPLLQEVLRGQAEWNAAMVEAVCAAARPGPVEEASATRTLLRLESLSDPLRREGLSLGVQASSPLWREVLRRQGRFNAAAVQALAGLIGARTPPPQPPTLEDYPVWCARREPAEVEAARQALRKLARPPLLSLVVATGQAAEGHLRECLASVEAQVYPHWELILVEEPGTSPAVRRLLQQSAAREPRLRLASLSEPGGTGRAWARGLSLARGELLGLVEPEATLAPHALAEVVLALEAHPQAPAAYADEDRLQGQHRHAPFLKPDWSPDLLRSVDYPGPFFVLRRTTLEAVGGLPLEYPGAEGYALRLRVAEQGAPLLHVPRVLCHRRVPPGAEGGWSAEATQAGCRALAAHLARTGEQAEVSSPAPGRFRVRYPVRGQPKVSIIVPFKDKPELLRTLVSTLLERTAWPHYEVLLVSNNSTRPETYALLEQLTDPRLVKLRWDHPFNYPAINNWAARQATGELLLFLNNDMEVVEPGWLEELISHAQRPEVGAVGAKLLFPEGTVQHAGVVVGLTGFAGHPFWRLPEGPIATPLGHTEWVRNWLAVTSACVLIRRQLFEEVGGYDERFQVCGSDVELGLRLSRRGLRVVYTPYARLIHHESASRRADALPESDYWYSYLAYRPWLQQGDPYYHPGLTLLSGECALRHHEESGEQLATRVLAHEVPSARDLRLEEQARQQRHVMEHLGELDCSAAEVEAQRRSAPAALQALRAHGRVERMTWLVPAFGHVYGGIQTILRFAWLLRRRHGVESDFLLYDKPGARAEDYAARATAVFGEEVGPFRVLHGQRELAELPAVDMAVATWWTSAYWVLRHPRAGVRAYFVQDYEPLFTAAGTRSALAEQTYRLGLYGIFNTRGLYEYVTSQYGMEGCFFEPAVDGALFHARRPERRGPVRIFFYGRPGNERNGFELGLAALAALKRELGEAVEVVCAGAEWSPESYGVRGLVQNLGLLPAERTAALYRECDVGLCFMFTKHPSYLPLEMMACGVAVVTNDNPANHWLLRHEENCLLAAPTPTCVLEQLRRVVVDAALRARLSARAAERARSHSWEQAVEEVWEALLGRAGARQP